MKESTMYIQTALILILFVNPGIVSAADDTDRQLSDRGFTIIPPPAAGIPET